jgi:predicted Fe-Mo cluster-binding NifX family protein
VIGRASDDEICHGAVEVLSDYRAFHLEEEEDRGGLGAQALTVVLLGEGGRADRESTDMLPERLRAGGLLAGRPGLGSPARWFSVGAMPTKKIAFPSSDGLTISRHFGHVKQFVVVEAHEGAEIERSVRQTADSLPIETLHTIGHDHDALLDLIADCDTIVAGGMGKPMADRSVERGFEVILTSERELDMALARYQIGELAHEPSLAHAPRRT